MNQNPSEPTYEPDPFNSEDPLPQKPDPSGGVFPSLFRLVDEWRKAEESGNEQDASNLLFHIRHTIQWIDERMDAPDPYAKRYYHLKRFFENAMRGHFRQNPWLVAGPQVGFMDTPPNQTPQAPQAMTQIEQPEGQQLLPAPSSTPPEGDEKRRRRRVSPETSRLRSRSAKRQRRNRAGKFYDNPGPEIYRPNPNYPQAKDDGEFILVHDIHKKGYASQTFVKYDPEWQVLTVRSVQVQGDHQNSVEIDVSAYPSEARRMWRFVKEKGFPAFLKALKKAKRAVRGRRVAESVITASRPVEQATPMPQSHEEENMLIKVGLRSADQAVHAADQGDFETAMNALLRIKRMLQHAMENRYQSAWHPLQTQWTRARSKIEQVWPGRIKGIK